MFTELLKTMGRILEFYQIPYMIIGGQAVLLYGEPRLTKDIDVTLGIGWEDVDLIKKVIEDMALTPLVQDINDFVKETLVLPAQSKNSGIRVDFIFSYSLYEKKAIERANVVKIGDIKVRFVSVEDLIIHKIAAGRARDIEDIKKILLKNPEINEKYILYWLEQFDRDLGMNFSDEFNKLKEG